MICTKVGCTNTASAGTILCRDHHGLRKVGPTRTKYELHINVGSHYFTDRLVDLLAEEEQIFPNEVVRISWSDTNGVRIQTDSWLRLTFLVTAVDIYTTNLINRGMDPNQESHH